MIGCKVSRGWLAAAVATAFVVTSVAGCTSRKDKHNSGETAAKPANGKGGGTAKPAVPSGFLRLPSNEPVALNPILAARFNRASLLVFEGLIGLGPQLEPVPRLAESWKISDDGKTITFNLRKGVTFSDGTPFTADDVAFTLESLRNVGDEPSAWAAYFTDVEKVDVVDKHTVKVQYKVPYAPALKTWTVGIIPKHIYGGGALVESEGNQKAIGTGPYRVITWERGKNMRFEANERWWGGAPQIKSVELVFNPGDRIEALEKGEVDFIEIKDISKWVSRAQLPEFREKFEVGTVTGSLYRQIAWNTEKKPFSDPAVRRALSHALNRERVVSDVFLGQAVTLSAPFFPNMYGADPAIATHSFDLDRATKLLDEAGLPSKNGRRFAIELMATTSQRTPPNEEMFAIFRRDLASIGVALTVKYLTRDEWTDQVIKARKFDAAFFGWLPEIPDPDPSLLLGSAEVTAGKQNYAGFANAAVDDLLKKARITPNRDERRAVYHQLHKVLHEQMPYTVLYAPFQHYAWNRKLRGVNPADVGAQPRFPGVTKWRFER